MPTKIVKRIWCKHCNDFTLHDKHDIFKSDYYCNECDTKYESVLLSTIPIEKLEKQRTSKKRTFTNIFKYFNKWNEFIKFIYNFKL